jgi:hypothetical protein
LPAIAGQAPPPATRMVDVKDRIDGQAHGGFLQKIFQTAVKYFRLYLYFAIEKKSYRLSIVMAR